MFEDPPSVFDTTTLNAPGVAAAEFAGFVGVTLRTIEVALTEVTDDVKDVPSTAFANDTVAPVAKPVPVMVTVVAAVASQIEFGLIEVMTGVASRTAADAKAVLTPLASVRTAEQVPPAAPVAAKSAVPVVAEVSATLEKTSVPAVQVATRVSFVAPLLAKPLPVNVAVPVALVPVEFAVAP